MLSTITVEVLIVRKKSVSVLSGKGFYIVLALSVAMVGAACYFAYTQTGDDLGGSLDPMAEVSDDYGNDMDAANVVTDVTKPTAEVTETKWTRPAMTTTVTLAETQLETEECINNDTGTDTHGDYMMPVDGEVLSEFSGGELVKSETTGAWQTHNGVDIKAAVGDAVKAVDDGTVKAVENDPLWGVTVTIDHGNGIVTKYCNLNSGVTVQAGQKVSGGEEIGAVGSTADIESSTQSHLHFEVLKNGSYTDPKELF